MALSSNQEESVNQLVGITGCTADVAKAFLKATSWDLQTAMDRYYAFGGDASKLAPPSNNNQPSAVSSQPASSMVSATANMISQAMSGFLGYGQPQNPNAHSTSIQQSQQNASSLSSSNAIPSSLSQSDQDALLAQQLAAQDQQSGQPFVRAPDAAYHDRLVGPYTNQYGSSVYKQRKDAQENFAKDWQKGPKNNKSSFLGALFSDPDYKFAGSLEEAKKKGSRENKWVLVNIQDTENFCSHCLNRDIWKDKDLSPVIKASFIFYQWVAKTDNAKRLINLYHPPSIPCIFILDPATGRQEHTFIVPDTPDKINQLKPKLLEFLDDYPNPKAKPKRVIPKHIPTKDMAPQSHEDKMLQEAIQASLMENKENKEDDVNGGYDENHNKKEPMNQDENEEEEDVDMEQEQEEEENLEDQLEPQPDAKDPNATAIRIRMPNGGILQRLFMKEAKVQQLYIWCRLSLNGKGVSLLQTMPRLKLDDQKEKTLKELGLIRATLVCSYED